MNKESFLQNTSWIDMLKFKISYGAQGNDNIGNYYAYLATPVPGSLLDAPLQHARWHGLTSTDLVFN